ncbi:hypothetical protein [Bradyrhizobium yuanmingense]|uniref:hypothetical protein n=1 Tax=Bradyrhizobium yuanmingense TaxID=108015 RepID=UPI0023B98BD2|nr:hypothetical protein [Bradyrhizobium yuanmingense]MDF0495739.1 hypothetical protein [Bradyrhizobium yuanmingense]
MANDILWLFDKSGFTLRAEAQPGSETFSATTLEVAGTAGPGSVKQTLKLKSPIDIPRKLLKTGPADHLVFRTKDELEQLAQEEWAALRDRLRRRLAQPFEVSVDNTDTLFELQAIASQKVAARLWLMPEVLDPAAIKADTVLVRVEADASVDIDLTLTAGAAASLKGRWRLDLRVKAAAVQDAVDALLALELPSLPAFDLDWPRFKLPKLSFAGLSFPTFGKLPSLFPISLPPFATKLTFTPDDPLPDIKVSLVDGDLSLATTGPAGGKLFYDANEICDVSNATFSYDGVAKKHSFTATLQVTDIPVGQPFPVNLVDDKRLPFSFKIAALSTTVTFAPIVIDQANGATVQGVTLAHELKGIRIAAVDDPTLFIVLDASFETTVQPGGGIHSKLTELKIAEPYPLVLIAKVANAAVEAVGELIRLIAAIPLPKANMPGFDIEKLKALLTLLARMLAAVIAWLARQAGEAAGLLAGGVEAVARLIGKLLDALADAALAAYKVVCIEVRLDARSYQIRQIVLTPANDQQIGDSLRLSALGFDLDIDAKAKPSLLIDFGPESWFGLIVEPATGAHATLSTDLWLDKETGPQQPLGTLDKDSGAASGAAKRLIVLKAEPAQGGAGGAKRDIVVMAVQRGRLRLFQRFVTTGADRAKDVTLQIGNATFTMLSKHQSARLEPAGIGTDAAQDDIVLTATVGDVKGRILGLLPKVGDESGGGEFAKMLSQKIQIDDPKLDFNGKDRTATLTLDVTVHLGKGFSPQTQLVIAASLDDLSMKVAGGDRIAIKAKSKETRHYRPLGFDLEVRAKASVPETQAEYEQFYLDLSAGGEKLGLGREADAFLSYDRVASAGKGLQFHLSEFAIGRSGLDLEARIKPDPVRLGGVDMPFSFTSGAVSIKGSRFSGGSLTGSGQLPKKLIGEAKAAIALTLGRSPSGGDVVVEAATALIDKSGDPIKCHSTRFDITITELGFSFVKEDSYHFYFLVTGSARFNPGDSAFARGLLKNFEAVEIRFDKAPLTSDPSVLMRAISFLVKLKPPKQIKLFDIFRFELRSIAFYPAADKFGGDPAMGFGGQVNFLNSGDKVSIQVNFHEMLIGPPKGDDILPRIRFDGLEVAISLSGVKVGGTAITVDGDLPSLYRPGVLPKNISAQGFLASGFVEIQGWAPMSATLGFLELKDKTNPSASPRHAFFIYGQMYKMSEPIDTPIGTIYLREVGFGFGYRYTLAGIAQAETAKTPQELVKILDEVSKYQGSLDRFEAWEPTYHNADLTLALRGMLALSAAQRSSSEYNDKVEATLPNPILLDIVAALRTDLTILINLRAWLCVNYHKWVTDGGDADWKREPVFRGYLYFSAPKREFLGRFISNRNGFIGEHPPMPSQLKTAIQSTDFSATLYVRPGLFHFELGWPYELGFELGKRGETFYLSVRGGLIHRVEDFSVLQGIAFKAYGEVHLEGRIGSDSFGAAAVAHATFDLETRLLSYLSLRNFDESMYYGYLRLDILIDARIEVWLSFKVFGKRIRLSAGFSIYLAVSIAIEGVVSPKGLGGKAHASVGIRAFGRTASVGIGFSFNNRLLDQARARVAGFMALGLNTPIPDKSQDGRRVENNPPPEPPRHEQAAIADQTIDQELGAVPAPEPVTLPELKGRPITETKFWAMLFPTSFAGQTGEWYVMQLVPRDHTAVDKTDKPEAVADPAATFFASPAIADDKFQSPSHILESDQPNLQNFFQLPSDGSARPVAWADKYDTNGEAKVDADVSLNMLLSDLFLDREAGQLTEPFPRFIAPGQETLADDSKAAVATLARHGRSRIELSARSKREAQIEEARSAIIASVLDTAAQFAAQGVPAGQLPNRRAEIDARDFGLTFLVSEASIEKLFPELTKAEQDGDIANPPLGIFSVVKSDAPGASGSVHLFNPPSRMFRRAQPRFTPRHVISEQGIMLDWDLEPAWGESQGAYHDPEFHLRHYRVRRTIRGLKAGEYRAEFVVKAAAPTRLAVKNDSTTLTMLRPPFQFIDDLRQKDADTGAVAIPDDLRESLLSLRQLRPEDINTAVDILYEIVPVDIAGTSDFGEPYEVPINGAPKPLPVSPRQAVLQMIYEEPGSPKVPEPRFLFTPKPKDNTFALHLRILTEKVEALGTYGNDALEQASRFDERSIERLRGNEVAEFVLRLKPGTSSDSFVFQNEDRDPGKTAASDKHAVPSEESKDLTPGYFNASIQMLKDGKLVDAKLSTILTVLDADDTNIVPGFSRRLFVRRLAAESVKPADLYELGLHGEWRSMPVNLVLKRKRAPGDPDKSKPISTILETFEQPLALQFKALRNTGGDATCESGRLHLIYPPIKGTIDDLAPALGQQPQSFPTLRDPARRTATRLNWRVDARSLRRLQGPDHAELYRWIGGYDLHVIDPDALPALSDADEVKAQLEFAAKPVGRVALMPSAFDGLEPSGFGDFGRLEAAYSSETLRLLNPPKGERATGMRRAGWYSPAESTAIFPQPALRRSLMPDPDEALIASLFAQGRPEALSVSIPAWLDPASDPLSAWRLAVVGQHGHDLGEYGVADAPTDLDAAAKVVRFRQVGGFKVAEVRRLLQNLRLRLVPDDDVARATAYQQETAALQRRIDDPAYLAAVSLSIEVLRARRDADGTPTADFVAVTSREHVVDLLPPLHPVLGDALAFLPYASQSADAEIEDGRIYRRYSIVADPEPEVKAKSFADWLDETPPERDPYGWGALRTLGLARGLRLYDSMSGEYLRGSKLMMRVRTAMRRALLRYRDTNKAGQDQRFNGQPFVDLLTKPWGNAKLFWFDGGGEGLSSREQSGVIDNETLAVIQIALRPAPDRLAPATDPAELRRVRYFKIVPTADNEQRPEWRLKLAAPSPGMRFDVLARAGGIEANPAVRLGDGVVHAFRVSAQLPESDKAIAIVRVILRNSASPSVQDINTALTLERVVVQSDGTVGAPQPVPYSSEEIVQPVVLDPANPRMPDPAFGKFEALKGQDWADAMFRPEHDGDRPFRLSPVPAFTNLAYPLARRFGRILLPQGMPVSKEPDAKEAEAAQSARAEVAVGIVRFWTRYLDHCAPQAAEPGAIFFSLGTVADPGVWRRAPDPSGFVSVTIPDPERRGARRKFAIRPYGRYESWIKALDAPGAEDASPDLVNALDETDFASQFLDVTLPRTEPLEKPVILAAQRRPAGDKDLPRMEIVVAHGTDMVLAQANRRNDAMLAPLGISVGYRREFPHREWMQGLVKGDPSYKPLAAFGAPDANFAFPALEEAYAETRLVELRKLVPDAWLGSTLVSAASLPYLFRTHALVHMSAGIVVSETTRAVFEEGFAEPHLPYRITDGYDQRTPSAVPIYEVVRKDGKTTINFDLALHRFIDCMSAREAVLWFGDAGQHWVAIRNVLHLPEPGISYRISIDASLSGGDEVVARAGEFDLLPVVPKKADEESAYLVQSAGQLLVAAAHDDTKPLLIAPQGPGEDWRLRLATVPREPGALRPFQQQVDGDLLALLNARLKVIVTGDDLVSIDVLSDHVLTCGWQPVAADWTPLWEKAMATLKSAPEAQDLLRQWQAPPQQGDKLTLPLSYPTRHHSDALKRLEVLCKGLPQDAGRELLCVRPLPSDEDLRAFRPGAVPTPVEAKLWALLLRFAREQLFGPGRSPLVSASKGTLTPLHHPIARRIEGEI